MDSITESYKNLMKEELANLQGMADAHLEMFIEGYLRRNPASGREQAIRAYREQMAKPIKAKNPNSPDFKFGGKYDVNSIENK